MVALAIVGLYLTSDGFQNDLKRAGVKIDQE
jgi:hypothetical protein